MARTNSKSDERITNDDGNENISIGTEVSNSEPIESGTESGTESGNNTSDTTETTGTTAAAGKRKRGRPIGSTNKAKNQETIYVQDQVKQSKSSKQSVKFLSPEESIKLTKQLIDTTEFIATRFISPEAKMMDEERLLLEFSLPNYLQTIELSTVEKASSLLYPLAALTGATMYAIRLSALTIEKYKTNKQKRETEQVETEVSQYQEESTDKKYKSSTNGEVDWTNRKDIPIRGY